MREESITASLKRLERYIYNIESTRALNALNRDARDVVLELRDTMSAARTVYAEAEASDNVRELIKATEASIERLKIVEESILKVSSFDLLGPVDVAELSAITQHIRDRLYKRISM